MRKLFFVRNCIVFAVKVGKKENYCNFGAHNRVALKKVKSAQSCRAGH